jgi:osmotically-inducible protein OsmY
MAEVNRAVERGLLVYESVRRNRAISGEKCMKSVILSTACVVALYAAVPATASPAGPAGPQAAASTSDHAIDKRIEQRLHANASLKPYHLKASVDGGVATLTGSVRTDAQKARAGQLAMVTGVTRVDNQITVDPNAGAKGTTGKMVDKTKEGAKTVGEKTKEGAKTVGEKTKEGAKTVGEKTKEGAKTVGEKTKEGAEKAGSEITDAYILTRVKGKFLGDDILKGSDINVDVDKHVVTLRGTVPGEAARRHAIAQAKEVEGVTTVVDKLTIGPKK